MPGMTMTEKILAKHAGKDSVEPGENVWVNVDILMTHDVCGPGTIGIFKEKFGPTAKVWDGDRVVIIPDHYIFTADQKCHRNVQILRDFVKEQGLRYYYDPEFVTSEPTPIPAPPAPSECSPPASATPTPPSPSAPEKPGSKCRRP
jgi:3-isopropylmalate/(R)-2-methylmalate dehydratase large subunit